MFTLTLEAGDNVMKKPAALKSDIATTDST